MTIDPRPLTVNITSSSGRVFRWGPDEADPTNVPTGITIGTQIPGGFTTFDCSLPRRLDLPYQDLDRFAPCTVTGMGGGLVAFDGYLATRPATRDASYTISPEAIGNSGMMKDDNSFSMVYIDRDMSKWQPWNAATQLIYANSGTAWNISLITSAVTPDQTSGQPAIIMNLVGAWSGARPISFMYYDAGANNVVSFIRTPVSKASNTWADANIINVIGVQPQDDLNGAGGGATNYGYVTQAISFAASTPQRYGYVQLYYNAPAAGGAGVSYTLEWQNLSVLGNHGLTLHAGSDGTMATDGFYGGDIIADIISRGCPGLAVVRGAGGIVNDTFVVPNLSFNAPVTPDAAVQLTNQYYLYDYGVYENRQFFWQPAGSGRQWVVRLGEGVKQTDAGPQIETAFNGVVVQYTDPAGKGRTVGPPGYIGDATDAGLQDLSSSNPCNAYGRKRWALVTMGVTTSAGAIQVGNIFLQTTNKRPSSGTIAVTGTAKDSTGREWPTYMMRAGDTVVVADSSDTTPHYILTTSYAHESLTNTLNVDAPPNKLDWLLQRLSLVISPLG